MNFRASALAFCIVLLIGLTGCETAGNNKPAAMDVDNGQFLLYMNLPEAPVLKVMFHLSSVAIVDDKGTSRKLLDTVMEISSAEKLRRQMLLAEQYLPEGRYTSLKLEFQRAVLTRNGNMADLSLPEGGLEIPVDIRLTRRHCVTLFLNWDSDNSVAEGYRFDPLLVVRGESPQLSSQLIYVTNEDSGTVSVINRQSGEVVSTIMVGNGPRGVAAALVADNFRVYVANSEADSFSIIEPVKNTVEKELPLRFGRKPEAVAVATLSPERNFIFITNYNSNTVSVIDASTYQEVEKVNVGTGPVAVAVEPPVEILFGTGFLSGEDMDFLKNYRQKYLNVYVANKHSNNISVLKINILNERVEENFQIEVKWEPVALYVDYPRGKVYVANYGFNDLSVIDILQLEKGNSSGAVSTINNVGVGITGVIADPVFERIYLLREFPGDVITLRLPAARISGGPASMTTSMIGKVALGESPRSFILDDEEGRLYAVNSGSDTVSVVNKITGKEVQIIPVGKRPYGIAMFPQ
jgi:YVTN family beta-propeller protein